MPLGYDPDTISDFRRIASSSGFSPQPETVAIRWRTESTSPLRPPSKADPGWGVRPYAPAADHGRGRTYRSRRGSQTSLK